MYPLTRSYKEIRQMLHDKAYIFLRCYTIKIPLSQRNLCRVRSEKFVSCKSCVPIEKFYRLRSYMISQDYALSCKI